MKLISIIKAVIIVLLLLLSYLVIRHSFKKEIGRIEENNRQLMIENSNRVLNLNKEEFKNYINGLDTSLKTILKENGINENKVTNVLKTEYHNHYDTILKLKIDTLRLKYKFFEYRPDSCNYLKVRIDLDSAYIDTFNIDSKVYIVHWTKRVNKKGKKVIWPLGKKKIVVKGFTNCSKNANSTEIEINAK